MGEATPATRRAPWRLAACLGTLACALAACVGTLGCAPTACPETLGCAPTACPETLGCAPTACPETHGCAPTAAAAEDPLPSWTGGASKRAIVSFVERVIAPGGPDYVPPAERIAVFDNDGTLWSEKPLYFQLLFAIDRIRVLAPGHPEWQTTQPFRAALEKDAKALAEAGDEGILQLVMASHAGTTTEEFERIVRDWLEESRHPRFQRRFTELVFQPMLELLAYLRASGFETFIVSGGGADFMRPWTETVYGIPPQQVVGSSVVVRFELRDGVPTLVRVPVIDFIDDGAGKPVGIHKFIGRRPIAAFGNSDGDLQMLQWTMGGKGARFALLVHHTDSEREWAYDRDSLVGRLDEALDEARRRGWTVVDMKRDWEVVYPFQRPGG